MPITHFLHLENVVHLGRGTLEVKVDEALFGDIRR